MKIILISGLFLALTVHSNYFIIASEQNKANWINSICCYLNIFVFFKIFKFRFNGILWSVVVGSFAYMMGLWLIVLTSYIGRKYLKYFIFKIF